MEATNGSMFELIWACLPFAITSSCSASKVIISCDTYRLHFLSARFSVERNRLYPADNTRGTIAAESEKDLFSLKIMTL